MKPKQRGTANEYRTANFLNARGYFTIRSAGSQGPFDIIGLNLQTGYVKLVQSKSNGHFGEDTLQSLHFWRGHFVPDYFHVELWDWLNDLKFPAIHVFNKDRTITQVNLNPKLTQFFTHITYLI